MRIEICGGIASGKTTLTRLLGEQGFQIILENFRSNPFWSDFYSDPSLFSFETEATFLLQHYSSIKKSRRSDDDVVICDYSIYQDLAYANVNLRGGEFDATLSIYEEIHRQLGPPEILVHLHCSSTVELQRIRQRNRQEENGIEIAYLDSLNSAIDGVVASNSSKCRVHVINSEEVDFAADEFAKKVVVAGIEDVLAEVMA